MYFKVQIGDEYQDDAYDFKFDTFNECSDFIKICLLNGHLVKVEYIYNNEEEREKCQNMIKTQNSIGCN